MSRLDEIKLRLSKITPGTWEFFACETFGFGDDYGVRIADSKTSIVPPYRTNHYADMQFIADAPDNITFLLSEVERLNADVAQTQGRST